MLFGRSSSVSYHLSAETHQERIMIASTELDEEVFRGRAEENPESARSVIYAIFRLIARILTFCDKKYRILAFRDKKYSILTFRDKKYSILTFRDKTESYLTVLQQNNAEAC